jgi:hypothetical protein
MLTLVENPVCLFCVVNHVPGAGHVFVGRVQLLRNVEKVVCFANLDEVGTLGTVQLISQVKDVRLSQPEGAKGCDNLFVCYSWGTIH